MTTNAATADVMTPNEICTYLGISRPTLFKMYREGTLPRIRIHQRRVVTPRVVINRFLGLAPQEDGAS
jgi:excisionase family DNA binding protein